MIFNELFLTVFGVDPNAKLHTIHTSFETKQAYRKPDNHA